MYLVILNASRQAGETAMLSVWVNTREAPEAEQRATIALTEAGYHILSVETVQPTSRDDYFRECPSLDAFKRAQQAGIAWRDDNS